MRALAGSSTDLTGGNGQRFFDAIQAWFQHTLLGEVLSLMVVVVGVGMLVAWTLHVIRADGSHK